ncbi:AMP-binding protein [Saccharicrinis sp. FJH62]|uniref:AMP-binding protein n=1 Tax=Saccharicrinis sp. FJH62 TaxID=3344657 RepID=UPI0035D4EE3F
MPNPLNQIKINNNWYDPAYFTGSAPSGIFKSDTFSTEVYNFLKEWYSQNDVIYVNTSGSTGSPSTIELHKSIVFASALKTCSIFKLTGKSTALLCLPVNYIAGKLMLIRAIASGMNLIIQKPDSNPLARLDEKIDFVAMTPMQLKKSIETPDYLKKTEVILIGGAPLDNSTHDMLNEFDTRIYQSYGMTETASHIALRPLNHTEIIHPYAAIPGVTFSIDHRNCLLIHAPHVSDSPIVTNDIVDLVDDNHFYWKGRFDFVINTGGVKVFPEDIESKLKDLIPFPFYISRKPDKNLGEKLVIIIEKRNSETYRQLKKKIESTLDVFERPREIIKVEKIRFSESGKVIRDHSL